MSCCNRRIRSRDLALRYVTMRGISNAMLGFGSRRCFGGLAVTMVGGLLG